MVYLLNGILLSNKKEQTTDTHDKIDESYRHYVEGKMPDTRDAYCLIHLYEIQCKQLFAGDHPQQEARFLVTLVKLYSN